MSILFTNNVKDKSPEVKINGNILKALKQIKKDINNRIKIIYNVLYKKVENTSMWRSYSSLKLAHSAVYREVASSSYEGIC